MTDENVLHLAKVTSLKKLDVTQTSVTEMGKRTLQQRRLDMKIERRAGAAVPPG